MYTFISLRNYVMKFKSQICPADMGFLNLRRQLKLWHFNSKIWKTTDDYGFLRTGQDFASKRKNGLKEKGLFFLRKLCFHFTPNWLCKSLSSCCIKLPTGGDRVSNVTSHTNLFVLLIHLPNFATPFKTFLWLFPRLINVISTPDLGNVSSSVPENSILDSCN